MLKYIYLNQYYQVCGSFKIISCPNMNWESVVLLKENVCKLPCKCSTRSCVHQAFCLKFKKNSTKIFHWSFELVCSNKINKSAIIVWVVIIIPYCAFFWGVALMQMSCSCDHTPLNESWLRWLYEQVGNTEELKWAQALGATDCRIRCRIKNHDHVLTNFPKKQWK